MNSTKATFVKLFASGLYSGFSPTIPGTTGTLPALVLAWFVGYYGDQWMIVGALVMTLASIWLATEAEHLFGHDSKKIVIDEWAGMFIALLFVPHVWTSYLLAFVAFRLLDAVKILGAAQAEKLPKGLGVTADDVVAGIQANLLTQLSVWLLPTIFANGQV